MRNGLTLAGTFVFATVLTASFPGCVGDDPASTGGPSPQTDAATAETASEASSSEGGTTTCQSDQILCGGGCVTIGPAHCGGCDTVCPASAPLCSGSVGTTWTCVASCPEGRTKCGEQCVDTATNPSNCGGCGEKCATPANGVASCANSTCDFTCKANFHACGDGCAADDDVNKCGPTCKVCSAPSNGTATCTGSCGFTCSGGLTACVAQNVCANTQTDTNNCGSCGKVCQIAPSCTTGQCNVKLGTTTVLGENCVGDSTTFQAYPVTVAAPITVTALGVNIVQYSSQYDLWLALYTDNAGKPGTALASSKSVITGNGSTELPVSATNIAAGTYWIGSTSSGFFKWTCSTSSGTYTWFDNGAAAYFNAGAAPSPAPSTTTLTGSGNFWLLGKE